MYQEPPLYPQGSCVGFGAVQLTGQAPRAIRDHRATEGEAGDLGPATRQVMLTFNTEPSCWLPWLW